MDTNERLATTIEHLASACAELLRERDDTLGLRGDVRSAEAAEDELRAQQDEALSVMGWTGPLPAGGLPEAVRGLVGKMRDLAEAQERTRDAEAERDRALDALQGRNRGCSGLISDASDILGVGDNEGLREAAQRVVDEWGSARAGLDKLKANVDLTKDALGATGGELLFEAAARVVGERDRAKAQLADLSERFGNMRDVLQLTRGEVDTLREALRAGHARDGLSADQVATFRAVVIDYRERLGAPPDVRAPEDVVKAYTERVEGEQQAHIDNLDGTLKTIYAENKRKSGVINDLRAEGSRLLDVIYRKEADLFDECTAHQKSRDEVVRLRDEIKSKESAISSHIDRHTQLRITLGANLGESAIDAACRVVGASKEYEGRIFELGRLLSQASAAGSDEVAGE